MNMTSKQMQKILTGKYAFKQLGFSMLITRVKGVYDKNPTPITLQSCTQEVNAFLAKYGDVMAADYAILTKI